MVYTDAPDRGADHAVSLLKDFSGVLQTDGYSVYQSLAKARNDIVLAHCWVFTAAPSLGTLKRKKAWPLAGVSLASGWFAPG